MLEHKKIFKMTLSCKIFVLCYFYTKAFLEIITNFISFYAFDSNQNLLRQFLNEQNYCLFR